MAKRIICIGDSNTYGYDPAAFGGARYPDGVRWTSRLGSAWDIQNLGENGREIPSSSFAVRVLLSQIRSRLPADGLCLMLGTNDLLCGASPAEAAERMRIFISDLLVCGLPLLLVAPPLMQSGTWVESDALIRSSGQLAPLYRDLAALCGRLRLGYSGRVRRRPLFRTGPSPLCRAARAGFRADVPVNLTRKSLLSNHAEFP